MPSTEYHVAKYRWNRFGKGRPTWKPLNYIILKLATLYKDKDYTTARN